MREKSNFNQFLGSLTGERIFFEPLCGNNGDELIKMGMLRLFELNGINPCSRPDEADVILLNGGGAMNDLWPEGAAQVIEGLIERFPGKTFVVGPSSYYFINLDFAEILRKANDGVTLFCRERISHESLQRLDLPPQVRLDLSQDLAFELDGSPFIEEQRSQSCGESILCAMRKDREGNAGILAKTSAPWLPQAVRRPLSILRDRLVAFKSSDKIEEILGGISEESDPGETIYRDVSVSVPFEDFCREVRRSRAIVTNRLHVAIFGTLLRKEVHLIRGAYHKNGGVYDFSLKNCGNVHLH